MTNFDEAYTQLDRFVEQHMAHYHTPGIAVAITDREKLLYTTAYGYADLASKRPITPDTTFEIGSIGKSFTAILLLQLYEAGQLDLHAPVTRYLPWFEVQSSYEPITIHHLLSHTAGIINGMDFVPSGAYEVWALRDTVAGSPPGQHFRYSNVGYKALGLLLEAVLKKSYGDLLQTHILDPLGMHQTDAVTTHQSHQRLATGYSFLYDDRPLHPSHPMIPATWLEYGLADGSPASTAADMAIYVRMLLKRGEGVQGRILGEASFDLMIQQIVESWGGFYGYGLATFKRDGRTHIGHGGGTVGYGTTILFDLEAGLGGIVMANGLCDPFEISGFALEVARASQQGEDLPVLPPLPDPTQIENAADYAGTYECLTGDKPDHKLVLTQEDERLILTYNGQHILLEKRGNDRFYVDHPDFALDLLQFGRSDEDDPNSPVVEIFHLSNWFVADGYPGPTSFNYPSVWDSYPGHYRSHNPWISNFRIVLQKGKLWLIYPAWGDREALVPLEDNLFRLGKADHAPDRLYFDAIVDGAALKARVSGAEYYRFFKP